MKKLLLVLLATAAISPAMAETTYNSTVYRTRPQQVYRTRQPQTTYKTREPAVYRKDTTSKYKLGNPLYRPGEHKSIIGGEVSYTRAPKNNSVIPVRNSSGTWNVIPRFTYGITDKLLATGSVGYSRKEIKSGVNKGAKINAYQTQVGINYQIASIEGFDFNAGAGVYYENIRDNKQAEMPRKSGHVSGTDINFQVGKKIQNLTPFFGIGFLSDFWSTRRYGSGTNTYINPGVYIDLHEQVGLKLDYTSITHGDATYRATLDFYPQSNAVLGFGAFLRHPETDANAYGALLDFKFGF